MTKFTQQELDDIKHIQERYQQLGIELIKNKLSQQRARTYLQQLEATESQLEIEISEINTKEMALAEKLSTKYGEGTLDFETGEFKPTDTKG